MPEREKRITLRTIDDLWADYLARVTEYRSGIQWVSWSGRDPHHEYLRKVDEWFREFEAALPEEIARRVESAGRGDAGSGDGVDVPDYGPAVRGVEASPGAGKCRSGSRRGWAGRSGRMWPTSAWREKSTFS